jgi:hypothetical protein
MLPNPYLANRATRKAALFAQYKAVFISDRFLQFVDRDLGHSTYTCLKLGRKDATSKTEREMFIFIKYGIRDEIDLNDNREWTSSQSKQ